MGNKSSPFLTTFFAIFLAAFFGDALALPPNMVSELLATVDLDTAEVAGAMNASHLQRGHSHLAPVRQRCRVSVLF